MFNNIFYEMGKKVIHWGETGGTMLITSWKCNFSIYLDIQVYYLDIQVYYLDIQVYYLDIQVYYLDIQAITTVYAFYWFFMC